MTHHNNHARSKQKRKALRQANRKRHIMDKRLEKLSKTRKPKGLTIYGNARKYATDPRELFPNGDGNIFNFNNRRGKDLNQRQKRKRARW